MAAMNEPCEPAGAADAAGMMPNCGVEQVDHLLQTAWGIKGQLTPLDGERDRNFLVTQSLSTGVQRFVLKVCNPLEEKRFLLAQHAAFRAIANADQLAGIETVLTRQGEPLATLVDTEGRTLLCRLTTWLAGSVLSSVQPRTPCLHRSLGSVVAKTTNALDAIDPEALDRPLLWDLRHAESVIGRYVEGIFDTTADRSRRALLASAFDRANTSLAAVRDGLPIGVIHNDANDNNVIVTWQGPWSATVCGLIDFGDMVVGWRVADLAIACAYAMLEQPRPLDVMADIVRGYSEISPLSDAEIHAVLPLVITRLGMSASIAAHQRALQPENTYLAVSEAPAWRMLETLQKVPLRYAEYLLRDACGREAVPGARAFASWLGALDQCPEQSGQVVGLDLGSVPLVVLDTSVSSPDYEPAELRCPDGRRDADAMARWIDRAIEDAGAAAAIGRYDEYRLIYGDEDFTDFTGHHRTLHLGIDVYLPAARPVYSALAGTVHSVANHSDEQDYGGTVIVRHVAEGENDGSLDCDEQQSLPFYLLYGHLDPESLAHLQVGDPVVRGQQIAVLGDRTVNGGWPPHLHFQIVLDLLDETDTFVGVCSHAHRKIWRALCPDPAALLGLPKALLKAPMSDSQRSPTTLMTSRSRTLSSALSTSYREPILMARGVGQYLYDATGRRYLDAVNNVPHVGHCHPAVVRAGARAARTLNTNTRYLYPGLTRYAERILATLPDSLEVAFLVNSGSEANDLALRLAERHTANQAVFVLDHAYHGNLSRLIDLSPYKHNGPGGVGTPGWVHAVPLQTPGRTLNVQSLIAGIDAAVAEKGQPAALFAEPVSGCGGQVVYAEGFLGALFDRVRDHGGICVADEVQTGFGRIGSHFWAFETHGVVPDIVTMGKPAGNGHPIGIVATTREIADRFANGMEYFNTFGGNPVSCAIGEAVLDVIEGEGLQQHAASIGELLIGELSAMATRHEWVTDLRGRGLFLGVELCAPDGTPAGQQAEYVVERMKQEGILISRDGPDNNVLKIKPPMVFDEEDAARLCRCLEGILGERWARESLT